MFQASIPPPLFKKPAYNTPMIDLTSKPAKVCHTSCAFLIHQSRILLVKHKKLQIWLAPGGHSLDNELPHQTAIRECFEETGNRVEIVSASPVPQGAESQYLPLPFAVNLHPIYHGDCQLHLANLYLAKPISSITQTINLEETDDLEWFTLSQTQSLATTHDIKQEFQLAFKLHSLLGLGSKL